MIGYQVEVPQCVSLPYTSTKNGKFDIAAEEEQMRSRHSRLAALATLCAALLIYPSIALAATYIETAMNHENPYDGTNNWGTASQGVEKLEATGSSHYLVKGDNLYWTTNGITWIRNSTQGNRYQPVIVFHAMNQGGGNCGHGYWESYWSDLPGNWGAYKPSDLGCDDNELRVGAGLPWSINAYQVYSAQGTWVDQSSIPGQIDIDNYWFDTQPPIWSGGVIIRDHQGKLCFSSNSVSPPSGSNYSCP